MTWNIYQSRGYCKHRLKMTKTWKYPYCCILRANQNNTKIRHNECKEEKCPIKIEVPEE